MSSSKRHSSKRRDKRDRYDTELLRRDSVTTMTNDLGKPEKNVVIVQPPLPPTKKRSTDSPSDFDLGEVVPDQTDGQIDSETNQRIYRNWTKKNTDTTRLWKASLTRTSFIYDVIADKYNKRISFFLLMAFIINTVMSMLTALVIPLNSVEMEWVKTFRFSIDIISLVLSATATILNGSVKMFNWGDFVTVATKYIERVESLYATVSGELNVSQRLRHDAMTFIPKTNNAYLSLMKQSPQVSPSDYKWAAGQYEGFLEEQNKSYKYAQKFMDNDAIIDMV